ncbi:TlpA family protein disulfide reductase [Flavobacterium sp. CBA20B-1]|uniref:TlpA family protein disulfide reductase n=1 Tax=unclassified Flavobacterium TaxID=196869 RepID=UPI002223F6D1|nr:MULTISPECIES: TlpA disulfide reductase family protein [unclassified Flavobacterium]WCM41920.1 TlpA family protein disulfide reductase [Flavobacterium sp. CBA20B-1]
MKHLLLPFFVLYGTISFCQTDYYSTNGKNRLSKTELDNLLLQQQEKLGDKLKGMALVANTIKTEIKQDSVIHYVTFGAKGLQSNFNRFSNYIDKPFPDFLLKDLKGEEITLDDLKGKPTIVNFWFTSCAPCIAEMPVLNKIKNEYSTDFNFIALTYETKEKVNSFLEKHKFNFNHIAEAKSFIEEMEVNVYPLNFFLDKNGIVKEVRYGIPKIKDEADGKIKMGDGKKFIEILEGLK